MKLSLIIAYVVFVVSLLASVIIGLQMVWYDYGPRPPYHLPRLLATSVIIMLAALFYVAVGEAMNRILTTHRNSSSGDKR
jgi:hypothetical protein